MKGPIKEIDRAGRPGQSRAGLYFAITTKEYTPKAQKMQALSATAKPKAVKHE